MAHDSRRGARRSLRVGEALRHALAELLTRGEGLDPILGGVSITVCEVRVSPDLRHARAYVLPLGGEPSDAMMTALRGAAPRLRGPLARAVRLKYAPALEFEIDRSFDEAARMGAVLGNLERRQRSPEAGARGDPDAGATSDHEPPRT